MAIENRISRNRLESEIRASNWINDARFSDAERQTLWAAKRILDEKQRNRNSFLKIARREGQKAARTLLCGFDPISGAIDDRDAFLAVKHAKYAAIHAFAAYPELREA